MKKILISMSALLVVGGFLSLVAWTNPPGDPAEIKREKANTAMTQAYGSNWIETYAACRKTNCTQLNAMTLAYESAIGSPPRQVTIGLHNSPGFLVAGMSLV